MILITKYLYIYTKSQHNSSFMNALRWNKLFKQLCSRLELSTWVLTTLGAALGVDVQQRLDPADVKVTLQDTSVTARPDDG